MPFVAHLAAIAIPLGINAAAFAQVRIDGYTRKDGTYAAPRMRSLPDPSFNNKSSTSPNIYPYTGQQGTRAPRTEPNQPLRPVQPYGFEPYATTLRSCL